LKIETIQNNFFFFFRLLPICHIGIVPLTNLITVHPDVKDSFFFFFIFFFFLLLLPSFLTSEWGDLLP
jgi:hypothetical protein